MVAQVELEQAKRRLDYQKPPYLISHIDLTFDLHATATQVVAVSQVRRNQAEPADLVLDGADLQLLSLTINGQDWRYQLTKDSLRIIDPPEQFELCIRTQINPQANTSLEGLYLSGGAFCTQCEAEGFRKISYFLDRPDVLSIYSVTINAEKASLTHLLSNGNLVEQGNLLDGRHFAKWHDPYPKPCYLFALVAGDFDVLEDSFVTQQGRQVALYLYLDKGRSGQGKHALESLKKAMIWDERRYGLSYDLDRYMIVAVDFFNMGAMENKGLNIFNSKYVLADSQTATDQDFFNIESVIAHEYFHNWTGNRVTCRDWFQLSLKEGLTVFRDQQFSADMASPLVCRINQVRVIREHQFAEDSGAMAHPIRPEQVLEMNNFYTVTVYDKGAEVIRMLHTLLGEEGFQAGMRLYFARHDGQAVTCDDFVQAMQDATDKDLQLFRRWYSQSGTPVVNVALQHHVHDNKNRQVLQFSQHTPPTADQPESADKAPLHIPIAYQLLASEQQQSEQQGIIELTQASQQLVVDAGVTPVLLENFSAPVRLAYPYSNEQLIEIIAHANDDFARWDACQRLYQRLIVALANQADDNFTHSFTGFTRCLARLLDSAHNPALVAELLEITSIESLLNNDVGVELTLLCQARKTLHKKMAEALGEAFYAGFQQRNDAPYAYQQTQVIKRRFSNQCLNYLVYSQPELAVAHYQQANNMTDCLAALKAAQGADLAVFEQLMSAFAERWQNDSLVMDKWLALHATTEREDILSQLELLSRHPVYDKSNPNKVRALIGSFAFSNPLCFHHASGRGYRFLREQLSVLDKINPQVAARLITPLTQTTGLDEHRCLLIRAELLALAEHPLSRDLQEKVQRSLQASDAA